MLSDQPAYTLSTDGMTAPLPGMFKGVLYEDCWTPEDALIRTAERHDWVQAFEAKAMPGVAEIDACQKAAAEAEERMLAWQRSATELERILADLDAGRVPAPPGDDIEPPQVARLADLIVAFAASHADEQLPAQAQEVWQANVESLRAHVQNSRANAASAALVIEEMEMTATSWRNVLEMEAGTLLQVPLMHNIVHDGMQILDWPECVTIGSEPVERRIIWNN